MVQQHFVDDASAGYQVGQGDVVNFEQAVHDGVGQSAAVGAIAGHLRRAGQGRFERGRTRGDKRGLRIGQQRHRGIAYHVYTFRSIGCIDTVVHTRGGGHGHAILRKVCCGLKHYGHIVAYLAAAAAGQKRYVRALRVHALCGKKFATLGLGGKCGVNFAHRGVADIFHLVVVALPVVIDFEGEDDEHAVH